MIIEQSLIFVIILHIHAVQQNWGTQGSLPAIHQSWSFTLVQRGQVSLEVGIGKLEVPG